MIDPLADLAGQPRRPVHPARCHVTHVAHQLTAEQQDNLHTLLAGTGNCEALALALALQRMGFDIGGNALRRHRRGACTCHTHPDGWQRGRRNGEAFLRGGVV